MRNTISTKQIQPAQQTHIKEKRTKLATPEAKHNKNKQNSPKTTQNHN
jgi:hypothetical protein